ncbi:MAG: ComEC/Rec2 family competence protein, partial [Leifsonia sp.]
MTFDLRLAIPAGVMWAVCAVAVGVADSAWWLAAAVWVVAGAGGVVAVATLAARRGVPCRRPRRRWLRRSRLRWTVRIGWTAAALSTIGAAAALTAIAADAPGRAPAAVSEIARSGTTVKLSVRIDTSPNGIRSGFDGVPRWMWRGTAFVVTDSSRSLRLNTPVTVIASLGTDAARKIAFGSTVDVEVALRPTEPGEKTSYVATAGGTPVLVAEPPPWLGWTGPLREAFAEAAAQTPGNGGALLPGLSIGDVTAVGPDLDEAMKASSLSHLTAVSGANCALVTGLVFFGCAYAGLGRRTRVAFALLALTA